MPRLRFQRTAALDSEAGARMYAVLSPDGERLGWVGTPIDGGWVAWWGEAWTDREAFDVDAHDAVRDGFAKTRALAAANFS